MKVAYFSVLSLVFEHAHEDGGLAAEAKVQLPAS